MLLEKIQKENDIKQLKPEELEKLAEEAAKVVNTINKHSSSSGGGSKGPNTMTKIL